MNEWFEAEQRVERAHEFYETGRWEDALRELRAALKVNPYQGQWHFNLGLTLDALGEHEQAMESFQQALECQGEDSDILLHMGTDALRLKQYAPAIQYFERAERVEPDDEASYIHRIEAYSMLGEHEQAEVMFYLACQVNDRSPAAYFNMASSLMQSEDLDRAISCLQEVRRIDPQFPQVDSSLAKCYWMKGQHERSHRSYLKHLRMEPGDTQALMELGLLLVEMNRPVDAAEKFRRITEQDPAHAEARFELGCLAMQSGYMDTAQNEFELTLRLNASYPQAHQKLAAIALHRKDPAAARRHLRAELPLLRLPGAEANPAAQRDLAGLLLEAQLPQEAAKILKTLVVAEPGDARLCHQLAVAHFMAGNLEPGIRMSRRAVRLDPAYLLAMHNLALGLMHRKQYRQAAYWVKRALSLEQGPGARRLRHLRSRLALLMLRRRVKGWIKSARRRPAQLSKSL